MAACGRRPGCVLDVPAVVSAPQAPGWMRCCFPEPPAAGDPGACGRLRRTPADHRNHRELGFTGAGQSLSIMQGWAWPRGNSPTTTPTPPTKNSAQQLVMAKSEGSASPDPLGRQSFVPTTSVGESFPADATETRQASKNMPAVFMIKTVASARTVPNCGKLRKVFSQTAFCGRWPEESPPIWAVELARWGAELARRGGGVWPSGWWCSPGGAPDPSHPSGVPGWRERAPPAGPPAPLPSAPRRRRGLGNCGASAASGCSRVLWGRASGCA
eukprot:gene16120-biopygen9769